MTTSVAGERDGWIDQYRYASNTYLQNQCYYKRKTKEKFSSPTLPPPHPGMSRVSLSIQKQNLDSRPKPPLVQEGQKTSASPADMLVSHTPKPRSSIQTKSIFLHQKRKKRSCRYTSPQTKSTISQIFSTQTQRRKKQKKKETPASQPAKGFLRISRQRYPSSTKRRKKLRNFRKFLHVQTKFTSCQFSSRTMKMQPNFKNKIKNAVSELSTSFVPFSWHTNT